MFADFRTFVVGRQIPGDQRIDCDICIIGSGAAGITIARELAGHSAKVVILESGGLDYDEVTHDLARIVVTGHSYPESHTRLRFFGGTTNHWGGHCVPLSRSIFGGRDWIPEGEWPFGLEEVEPYYVRAHQVLEIGPYDYDPEPVARQLNLPLLPLDPQRVETVMSRYNRMLFGYRYRAEVDKAPNISVFLFATVVSLALSADTRSVKRVDVKTPVGKAFSVHPKITVLATGGVDNARLLLVSNQEVTSGIGNGFDMVGRYFQEHINYHSGFILPIAQNPAAVEICRDEIPYEGDYSIRCHLALPESQTRALRVPDYRVELQVQPTYRYHEATVSMRRLMRQVRALEPGHLSLEDVFNVISDPRTALEHRVDGSKRPLVYGFRNLVEQVPNPKSRVRLTADKDALGMNRAELRWQLSSLDKEGIKRAQWVVAEEVGRSGVGRVHAFIPESEGTILEGAGGAAHHIGTTRMHTSPRRGVVDANARVHGVQNLFVAGSSIFPSCGYPNPTLTIVALSIRLADHIKASLGTAS